MIGAQKVWADHEVVCVLGNSMGWYTSLAVAGSLSFEDGFHLVQRMALWQETGVAGGQLIYPLVNEDWQPVPERKAAALAAIAAHPGQLFLSIDLGGYLVLAGSDAGLAAARKALPPVQQGGVPYPLRLAQHGPYHTPLAQGVSDAAVADLSGLPMALPRAPMIDGTGRCWSPWSSDLEALRRYTLVDQVIKPYDLRAGIAVAIKEFAPERLMLLGPGNTLGGITGQVLLAETWKGLKTRDDFRAHQAGPDAMVVSMGLARA
ncbi:MAG: hypothetical protein R3E96_02790 [Planctomycetota bacterium]